MIKCSKQALDGFKRSRSGSTLQLVAQGAKPRVSFEFLFEFWSSFGTSSSSEKEGKEGRQRQEACQAVALSGQPAANHHQERREQSFEPREHTQYKV